MKAVVAAFNQEKALVGAFPVITNLRMELFQALGSIGPGAGQQIRDLECRSAGAPPPALSHTVVRSRVSQHQLTSCNDRLLYYMPVCGSEVCTRDKRHYIVQFKMWRHRFYHHGDTRGCHQAVTRATSAAGSQGDTSRQHLWSGRRMNQC